MMWRTPFATTVSAAVVGGAFILVLCGPVNAQLDVDPMAGRSQAADFKIRLYASEQLQKFDEMGNILINGSFQGDAEVKINVIPPDERNIQNPFNWSSDYDPGAILKLTDEDMCKLIVMTKSAVCDRKHLNNTYRQRYCIASEELFLRYPDRLLGRRMVAPLKCIQPLIRDVFRLFLMDQFYCRAIMLDEDSFISDDTALMAELVPPNRKSQWREFSMAYFCTAFMASNLLFNKPASRAHFTINTCHLNPKALDSAPVEKNGKQPMGQEHPQARNHANCANGIIYCYESPAVRMAPNPGGAHLVDSQLKTICQRRAGVRIFSETYHNRTYASVQTMHGGSYRFELPDDRCFTMDFGAGDHDGVLRRTDGSTLWDDYGKPVEMSPYETAVKTLPAAPVIATTITVQGGGPDCNQYAIIFGENFSRCFFKWNAVLTCSNRKGASDRVCEMQTKTGVRTTHENETSITDSSTTKNDTKETKPLDARSAKLNDIDKNNPRSPDTVGSDTIGALDEPPTAKPRRTQNERRAAGFARRRAKGGGGIRNPGRSYSSGTRIERPLHREHQPSPSQRLGGPPPGVPPETYGQPSYGARLVRGGLEGGLTGVANVALGDKCYRQHPTVTKQILWAATCAANSHFQTSFGPIQSQIGNAVREGIRSELGFGQKPGAGPPNNVSPFPGDPDAAGGVIGSGGGGEAGGGGESGGGPAAMCGQALQKTRGEISTSFSQATTHSETNRLMDATTLINETTITSRITTPPGFDQVLAQLEFHCNGLIIVTNVMDVFSASLNDTGGPERDFMETMGNVWKSVRKPLIKVGVGAVSWGLKAGIAAKTGGVGALIAGPFIDMGAEWAECKLTELVGDQCDQQQQAQQKEEAALPDQPPPAITGGGPLGQPTNWKQPPCAG